MAAREVFGQATPSSVTPADDYPLIAGQTIKLRAVCGNALGTTVSTVRLIDERLPAPVLEALSAVARTLAIRPSVGLIDEPVRPIMQVGRLRGVRDGLLSFNRIFVDDILRQGIYAKEILCGVLAHEFAHVLQIRKDCIVRFKPRDSMVAHPPKPCSIFMYPKGDKYFGELHADFMSGWTLAKLNILTTESFGGYAKRVFVDGDDQIQHADHHGTPRERLNAMATGFDFARTNEIDGYYANQYLEWANIDAPIGSVEMAFAMGQTFVAGRKA